MTGEHRKTVRLSEIVRGEGIHYRNLNRMAYEYVFKTVTAKDMEKKKDEAFTYVNESMDMNFLRQHFIRYFLHRIKEYEAPE